MRYFITLSYDGTRFHGWQVQPNGISVQGELQRGLSLLLREEIQKYLRTIPGVASVKDEDIRIGGSGVTLVTLE